MMMDKYSFLQIRHDSYILNTAIFAYNLGSLRIVVSTSGCGPENLGSIPRGCTPAFFSQSSGVRRTVENDSIVRPPPFVFTLLALPVHIRSLCNLIYMHPIG